MLIFLKNYKASFTYKYKNEKYLRRLNIVYMSFPLFDGNVKFKDNIYIYGRLLKKIISEKFHKNSIKKFLQKSMKFRILLTINE